MNQQNKLLGHIIRADPLDPMRRPTITNDLQVPGNFKKRVGRPRFNWVLENCKWIHKKIYDEEFDIDCPDHVNKLRKSAIDRNF